MLLEPKRIPIDHSHLQFHNIFTIEAFQDTDIYLTINMNPETCSGPCFVPPHPDLLARTKAQALRSKENSGKPLLHQGRIPGMNDGTIFPKSHYEHPTSVMGMSAAALDRTPLRGVIR